MRSLVKRILVMIVALSVLLSLPAAGSYAAGPDELRDFSEVAANAKLALYVKTDSGEYAVLDKKSGTIWWSNPVERSQDKIAKGINLMNLSSQFIVKYGDFVKYQMSLANNYTACVRKDGAKVEKEKNGFKVTYTFPDEKFSIPIRYTLNEDSLYVEILVSEIVENGKDHLFSIGLLPYFGAGGKDDSGYLFVPDGSGALINFNNGKGSFDDYNGKIYGRDKVLSTLMVQQKKEEIRLPVFGIKNGNHAILAVVDKGDALGAINASVGGGKSEYNNVYCDFEIRSMDSYILGDGSKTAAGSGSLVAGDLTIVEKGSPRIDICAVRYYFLNDEADYNGMARKYREYLISEKGVKPAKNQTPSLYIELFGGMMKKKPVFGIPMKVFEPMTSFENAEKIVRQLKNEGVEDIVLTYRGWMKDEIEGKVPVTIDPMGPLGGRKGLEKLVSYCRENKVGFYPQVDFTTYSTSGNGFSVSFDSTKMISRSPAMQFMYKLSTFFKDKTRAAWYLLSPGNMEDAVQKFLKSTGRYDIAGIGDRSLASNVYSDFSKNPSGRQESMREWEKLMKSIGSLPKDLLTESANAYALPYVSHIIEAPSGASGFDIEDEEVPFYQMVLHGMIPYATRPINLDSEPETLKLKAMAWGAMPYYTWVADNVNELKDSEYSYLFGADYRNWLEQAAREFNERKAVYQKIAGQQIISYRRVQPKVYETQYANNVKVIVNYNPTAVKVEENIVKANSCILLEGRR